MAAPTTFKLFRRSNGIYYLILETNGKRKYKSTGCTRKAEALRTLTEFRRLFAQEPPATPLADFTRDLLAYGEVNLAPGTVTIYRSALKKLREFVGDVPISSLTARHLDDFKSQRLVTVRAVTVNIELRTLRAAFNTAVRWKLLDRNPFEGVRLASVPEASPSHFTKADFERLLSTIKEGWLREVVLFAVMTGLRCGEICNLRWSDVDLERRLIHVRSSSTFRTKMGKTRTVPLGVTATALLKSKHTRAVGEYVFCLNDKQMRPGWLSHKFKYYVYEARLKNDTLHFHSLRHTFATWLVQAGTSIFEVQRLLGHSDIKVTQVYSHLQSEGLHGTVDRIDLDLN